MNIEVSDLKIDLDKPITYGGMLRHNASAEEYMAAARMDAITYLRLTGQPITASAVDRIVNKMRDFPVACSKDEKA